MKFFVAIVFFAILAGASAIQPPVTVEQKEMLDKYAAECLAEGTISEMQLAKLISFNFFDITSAEKCFLLCMFQKVGFYVDGVIQDCVIFSKMCPIRGSVASKALISKCNCLNGTDACDSAYRVFQCYLKENSGIFI